MVNYMGNVLQVIRNLILRDLGHQQQSGPWNSFAQNREILAIYFLLLVCFN